jgi:hypothetical protein
MHSVLAAEHPNDDQLMALMGHQRRFKRKPRTSAYTPTPESPREEFGSD